MISDNIKVTTTNNLDGWEITEYLKPISSHVVAGTNIFSDAFAGISDIFGGRSKSYQNQIASINNEAINLLKEKAIELNADCIIGLSLDQEQISGKGKSMFMVTACGTAIKANTTNDKKLSNQSNKKLNKIGIDELRRKEKVNNILDLLNNDEIIMKDNSYLKYIKEEHWKVIIENKIIEAAKPVVLELVSSRCQNKSYKYAKEYFSRLPIKNTKKILYQELISGERAYPFIKGVIQDNYLIDYSYIIDLIETENDDKMDIVIELLKFDKMEYNTEDLSKMNEIINEINTIYSKSPEIITKDKMFSSKPTKMWKCIKCGHENNSDIKYCVVCNRNKQGLKKKQIDIINNFKNRYELLKANL